MPLRDHEPVVIDQFNGLWNRGDIDNVPLDHFTDCNNVKFVGSSSIATRDGIGISQDVAVPLEDIKRIYNFPTQIGNTLIVLAYDIATDTGSIYHVVDETTVYGPLLQIVGMTDFAFTPYAGRGYISPFSSLGPKTSPPVTALTATLVEGTVVNSGIHKYASTFVTATGETTPSPLTTVTTDTAGLADPVIAPVLAQPFVGANNLVNGGTYKWKITYSLVGGLPFDVYPETLLGPVSNTIINDNTKAIGLQLDVASIPANVVAVTIYRTVNGGAAYFRESGASIKSNYQQTGSGGYNLVGLITDAQLVTYPAAPVVNNTATGAVDLSAIPAGFPNVTARKIYRTEANLDQLKLLTTLADNTTVIFSDTTADAGLGADIPTTNTATLTGLDVEKGLENEFLYVYAGDGTAARKAAGVAPTGALTIANGAAGNTDAGFHLFAVVFETLSGALSAPGAITGFTTAAAASVSFGTVPTGSAFVVRRHIVATKVIVNYTGNTTGYDFFFIPDGTIDNNTDAFLNNISFFDADLLDDASHLIDNYAEIPAGAVLTLYHNRLVLGATFNDISLLLVSEEGEPEAINQISGLIVVPLDGNPVTNAQELRDVLYVTKRSRTVSYFDNGDIPSSWPLVVIDNALGTNVHGIATVLDSGSASVDFLIIATYQGISLFNGRYVTPELSWKIEKYWRDLDRTEFKHIQILNDSIKKQFYIVLPTRDLLVGNYANGLDPKKIRWAPWSFDVNVNTVAIVNTDEIILGADIIP